MRDGAVMVRELARGDLQRAAQFCERARGSDPAIEPFADRLTLLAEGPRALLDVWRVAESENGALQGIAFAALRELRNGGGSTADVYVAVAPQLRRKSIGRELCAPALRWASAERVTLRARVRDDASPGQAFLGALGFRAASAQLSLTWSWRRIEPHCAPSLHVRRVAAREAVTELERLTREAWSGAPEAFRSRSDELAHGLADEGRLILIGEIAGRAVGYLSAVWLSTALAIEEVAVLPGARRRGVGRALLATALRGAASAMLSVVESNLAARSLYDSIGFTPSARHLVYELRHD